ncbi:MAG: sensor histidine kinase [Flammeovirgaceae bacterium]
MDKVMKNLKATFLDSLVDESNPIPSHSDYNTAVLFGLLNLVTMIAYLLYAITNWFYGINGFMPYYAIGAGGSLLAFYLNKKGRHLIANIWFLLMVNGLVLVFSSIDHYRTGVHIHFVNTALVAVAFFGYRNRLIALAFCVLSFSLFWISYVWEIKLVNVSPDQIKFIYGESYIQTSFIANFSISVLVSCSFLMFLIHVTKSSEKELMKTNELLSKTNKELDRFVYSASHDLKAPLSSVLGLIEIAQRTDDKEEVKICLEMMKNRVHNLDGFIKDITNYSRNSRLDVKKEKINLLEFIKDLVDELRYAEGFESIYFKYDIPADLELVSDKARLKVVLNNLVANALKYHDPDKDNPFVEIKAMPQNGTAQIEIIDNGLGIDAKHINNIFDMFYRASEKSNGSGLGLYIVKETLEKISGSIKVESQLQKGSSFIIHVPTVS